MLRHCKYLKPLLIAVLVVSGTVFSQRKGGEVTVTRCWQFPAENVIDLATNGRDIFAATDGGHILAVSSRGEKLWQTDVGGEIASEITVAGEYLIVPPGPRWLSLKSGLPIAAPRLYDPPLPVISPNATTASTSGREGLVVGNDAGLVTSLSGSGPVWKFKTGGGISAIIPVGEEFVVISRDDFVYSLYASNGGLQWKRRLQGRIGHYALGKGFLFVSSLDQHGASFIDLTNGRVAGQIILNGEDLVVTDPAVIDDNFIVATGEGISAYSLSACAK